MVSEAMLPRAAVREVEQRLTAAGCPDADFDARELFRLATGRDVRLSDRPLTAEQAAALEVNSGSQVRPLSLRRVHSFSPCAFPAGTGCSVHGAGML